MLTKAIVTKVPRDDNWYQCRIPLFEDTTGTEMVYDALCCHAPGVFNGLNVGDCVYVSFEDNKLDIPVIIGRLYTKEQDDYSKGYFNNLNVTNSAKLPINTIFGNGLSAKNIYTAVQYINSIEGQCPYKVGDIYSTTNSEGPVGSWPNTEWEDFGTVTTSTGQFNTWRRTK